MRKKDRLTDAMLFVMREMKSLFFHFWLDFRSTEVGRAGCLNSCLLQSLFCLANSSVMAADDDILAIHVFCEMMNVAVILFQKRHVANCFFLRIIL